MGKKSYADEGAPNCERAFRFSHIGVRRDLKARIAGFQVQQQRRQIERGDLVI